MHNVQTMKTKDKTTNEDNVGKTRFLSLRMTLIETSTIAHGIQYQLILLGSLSLFNKCLNTSCGLGNSRDPNTLSDLLRDCFLPQTSAWANSIITTFDRFVTPEPCLALAFQPLSLGVARCELRPAGDPQISRNTSTRTSAK